MSGKIWTSQEDAIISARYPDSTIKELMEELTGRSWRAIYNRAALLGIKKSPEFLRSEKCGRLYTGHQKGINTQFKAGNSSWNKGIKGLQLGGEKGWFKKGNVPPNTHPEGDGAVSIRYTKGIPYKYIRVELGKWRQLHTHTWEQANGAKLPKGHIVVFKDGDTMNCALDNLEMISCKDNMLRNTIQRYPSEVKDSIRLLNKLTKTIKSHEKQTC